MAKPAARKKLGRNDPCHCGSGRKYKDCHLPQEEAFRSEQLRLRQAQDTLLPKIIEAAQLSTDQIPAAFDRFWQGRYSPEQLGELDDLEDRGGERFLTWFAFDYRQSDGRTLVEQLESSADGATFQADEAERALLAAWRGVRLRPYLVEAVRKGSGVTLRDLLGGQQLEVADYGASKRLGQGEVVVGHLVPVDRAAGAEQPTYYLAGAAAQLTADTAERLVEYAELHLADLRRRAPEAGWDDLIDERSELLNHFVSALPREEQNPTIMDEIIAQGRASLQLTAEGVRDLLGRKGEENR